MSLAVSTSPSKMSESFLPPAEVEELQEELDTLKADNTYVEFVEAVVTGKDVPLESDSEDPLYPDPASERQGSKSPEEGAKSGGDGEDESGFQDAEEGDGSGSDSDDTLADEEDEEEEVVEEEAAEGGAAAVPARMKIEANKRYPPFWKTKMKLKAATDAAPEDEDAADADYCPPTEEEDDENSALDAARMTKGDSKSDSDSDGDDEIEEMAEDEPKGPIDDNDDVMRELRAGLDEMHVVQEEVTREEQEAGAKGNILREITSFDDSTYDESTDADYAPPADIDEIIDAQAEEDEEKLEQGEEEQDSDEEQMETEV